jgi:DNA-binding transcriptional LysR family regulator
MLEAVIAGLGRSLLPSIIADGDARLRRIRGKRRVPVLARELWLLIHSELRKLDRIEAVVNWIEQIAPR